jgi:hypothetical protein
MTFSFLFFSSEKEEDEIIPSKLTDLSIRYYGISFLFFFSSGNVRSGYFEGIISYTAFHW